ncbi:protein TIC 21, chloroplastic-like isoform X1 [Rhododendron vialii]|uniref:protein TIC 21, chloroplastic-like isoform X1 n=1 Tax=Rhododendron vialii TaxID=182163 RepID=UPI00265F8F75|nr:protein TIC 21, chloroplastic-like isoform X1 [Rhododendron vialii]
MQAQPSPASRPGGAPPSPQLPMAAKPLPLYLRVSPRPTPSSKHSPTRLPSLYLSPSSSPPISPSNYARVPKRTTALSSSPISTAFTSPNDDPQKAKLAQVAKRLESTSRYFKRLGSLGFWGQLVCTVVTAVILSFSVVLKGKITSPATFYATAGGIAAAFVSVFWSFGFIRLSDKLRRTANEPSKTLDSAFSGSSSSRCPEKLEKEHSIEPSWHGCCCPGYASHCRIAGCKSFNFFSQSFLPGHPTWLQPCSCIGCFLGAGISKHYPFSFLGTCLLVGAIKVGDFTTVRKHSSSEDHIAMLKFN